MRCQKHEEAHPYNRRARDQSNHGSPDEEVAHKALDSTRREDQAGSTKISVAAVRWSGESVEETGKDAAVGTDVFENGNGVEG